MFDSAWGKTRWWFNLFYIHCLVSFRTCNNSWGLSMYEISYIMYQHETINYIERIINCLFLEYYTFPAMKYKSTVYKFFYKKNLIFMSTILHIYLMPLKLFNLEKARYFKKCVTYNHVGVIQVLQLMRKNQF